MIFVRQLPKDKEPNGFLELGFDDVDISVRGRRAYEHRPHSDRGRSGAGGRHRRRGVPSACGVREALRSPLGANSSSPGTVSPPSASESSPTTTGSASPAVENNGSKLTPLASTPTPANAGAGPESPSTPTPLTSGVQALNTQSATAPPSDGGAADLGGAAVERAIRSRRSERSPLTSGVTPLNAQNAAPLHPRLLPRRMRRPLPRRPWRNSVSEIGTRLGSEPMTTLGTNFVEA